MVRSGTVTPSGRARARSTRARSRAAKVASGSTAASGWRRASNGSAIEGFLPVVAAPEGGPGPDEQGLGAMDGPVQKHGHLGDGQVVEVTKCKRGAVMGGQGAEDITGPDGVDPGVPRIVPGGDHRFQGVQSPFLPGLPAPVVDELVPGHND